MRKKPNGIITIVMASVTLVVVLAVTALHCAQAERVVVEEKSLHGNPSEVADITLTQYDSMDDHLVWTTRTPLADVSQSETEMQYSREKMRVEEENEGMFRVWMNLDSSGYTSSDTIDFRDERHIGRYGCYPMELYLDVASRVPKGEQHTETVRVADYGDYYYPVVDMFFPADGYRGYTVSDADMARISEQFRQPIGANDKVTVTMTHNGVDGINAVDVTLDASDGEYIDGMMSTVYIGQNCYVAVAGDEGVELHELRFEKNTELRYAVDLIDIQQVATFAGETMQYEDNLKVREGRNQLLVMCGEARTEKVIVFSLDEMKVVQEIPVLMDDLLDVYQRDDYMVFYSYDGDFVVYEDHDGQYAEALDGNYSTYMENHQKSMIDAMAMDYSDGTLITATREYGDQQTISVAVNTVHGCVFTGAYTTSLQEAPPSDGYLDGRVRQWQNMPLEIVRQ